MLCDTAHDLLSLDPLTQTHFFLKATVLQSFNNNTVPKNRQTEWTRNAIERKGDRTKIELACRGFTVYQADRVSVQFTLSLGTWAA